MTKRKEFTNRTKAAAFNRAGGKCEECTRKVGVGGEPCEYDHHLSCEDGGDNGLENCRVLCAGCHSHKTHKIEAPAKAEGRRHTLKRAGVRTKPRNPIPGSKASMWKRTIDGKTVLR